MKICNVYCPMCGHSLQIPKGKTAHCSCGWVIDSNGKHTFDKTDHDDDGFDEEENE